jgi:hypothetical protein
MTIICQQTATISSSNSILCNKLLRIYDIRPMYGTIDIWIEGQISPQVSEAGNSFTIGNQRYTIVLISKNVASSTAVVQLTISTIEVPPPPIEEITHHLDLIVKPYSWYSPESAANGILSKLGEINGTLMNLFSGVTDYQYISTEILSNEPVGNVTIRVNLKKLSLPVMSMVAIPIAIQAGIVVGAILLIIFFVGVITGWKFTLAGIIEQITGKKYSTGEVITIVYDNTVKAQLDECDKNYLDPNAVAGCHKAVICGAANGLTDALKMTGTDCASLGINDKIDKCLATYNTDGDKAKYYDCIRGVAHDGKVETESKAPKETDWTTLALVGLGVLAFVSMSKGNGRQSIIIDRERPREKG